MQRWVKSTEKFLQMSNIPHLNKPVTKDICQSIYWNLLQISKSSVALPTHFIKELEQTKRCDQVGYDFSLVRASYASHFNEQMADCDAYAKLLASLDNKFEYAATQTVLHYGIWTEQNLVEALSVWKKINFYTIYRAEKTLATIGIISSAIVGGKGFKNLSENYKNWEASQKL